MRILEKLSRERIFDIEVNTDRNMVTFTEMCDRNFDCSLTKEALDALADAEACKEIFFAMKKVNGW